MASKRKTATTVDTADRELVLANAARLFRENGYERTTVKQIADACGMLPGSLHYRYNSKEALLADIMRLGLRRATDLMLETLSIRGSFAERLKRGLQVHLHAMLNEPDLVYVLLFEWRSLQGSNREELIEQRDRYEQLWDAMLRNLVDRKVIRPDMNLKLLRLMGLGALNWVVTWYGEEGDCGSDEIADFFWQIIKDALIIPGTRPKSSLDTLGETNELQ